ncbi:MAG: 3-methyl-2-oxobutanoate hydroxymethyltransferase [Anaerolineaceae bacterium]|nr:3-methyl-2-oxobutanoate hydroxymethyltransferase [Anaerolineaceae bacterium]
MVEPSRVSLPVLFKKMMSGEQITMLICYDYPTGFFQDQADVDMILVGDSLGMMMLGYDRSLPVTMEDMICHSQAVRRGAPNAWLIGDMPYMSYQPSFGFYPKFKPKTGKVFSDEGQVILDGLRQNVEEVKTKKLPSVEGIFLA